MNDIEREEKEQMLEGEGEMSEINLEQECIICGKKSPGNTYKRAFFTVRKSELCRFYSGTSDTFFGFARISFQKSIS